MNCPSCHRDLDGTEFYSGGSTKCKGCMTYQNLTYNSKKEGHTLSLKKDEFLEWYGSSTTRTCSYCGITEGSFTSLGRKNPRGYHVQCLGVDRSDSSQGYTSDNVRIACLVCNRIKSNIFSLEEMVQIGSAVGNVWKKRDL